MAEKRKIAAIVVADIVGYGRLAGTDEERILGRLRALRSDLIDPTIAVHHGRVVKRTGDGLIVEFHSVVDAVRCASRSRAPWSSATRASCRTGASRSASACIWATSSRKQTAT